MFINCLNKIIRRAGHFFRVFALIAAFAALCPRASADGTVFRARVPTLFPVYAAADGTVLTADTGISNTGNVSLCVTGIGVSAAGGWMHVPYSSDYSSVPAGTRAFGMAIGGAEIPQDGRADVSVLPCASPGNTIPLEYAVSLPVITTQITDEGIAHLDLILGRAEGALRSISITRMPNKTVYGEGERFSPAGMVITAHFADGSSEDVSGYRVTGGDSLEKGQTSVVVTYTDAEGSSKSVSVPVTVTRVLKGIEVISMPYKTVYRHGERFSAAGLRISAKYSDGSSADIDSYSLSPDILTYGTGHVSASYSENGVSVSCRVPVTVMRELERVYIEKAPSKLSYVEGEVFDPAGATVKAVFTDGGELDVSSAALWTKGTLSASMKSVSCCYTLNGVTAAAEQRITVAKALERIEIGSGPAKTSYVSGEAPDSAGMTVYAVYSDGSRSAVNGFRLSPGTLKCADTCVTVSYGENGVTRTASFPVSVSRRSVAVPGVTVSGLSATVTNLDSARVSVSGTLNAPGPGTYEAVFTLKDTAETCWTDGSTAPKTASWTVSAVSLSSSASISSVPDQLYSGTPPQPQVTVTAGGKTLEKGRDYTLSYSGNVPQSSENSCTATVTATGTGSYCGSVSASFTVRRASYSVSYSANGGNGAPEAQLKYYGRALTLSGQKPSRQGYVFLGWSASSTASAASYQAGGQYTADSPATLYAVWGSAVTPYDYVKNKSGVQGSVTGYMITAEDAGTPGINWLCLFQKGENISLIIADRVIGIGRCAPTAGNFSYSNYYAQVYYNTADAYSEVRSSINSWYEALPSSNPLKSAAWNTNGRGTVSNWNTPSKAGAKTNCIASMTAQFDAPENCSMSYVGELISYAGSDSGTVGTGSTAEGRANWNRLQDKSVAWWYGSMLSVSSGGSNYISNAESFYIDGNGKIASALVTDVKGYRPVLWVDTTQVTWTRW